MSREMSRTERKAQFMEAAEEMFEAMEAWYDAHPDAQFEEIEGQARWLRRRLIGRGLEIWINGRSTGRQVEAPRCPRCGKPMKFVGYRRKEVWGLEGESVLERAYYVCPEGDGETFFPPG